MGPGVIESRAPVVLSEAAEQLPPSASARDIAASTEAARLAGCRVFAILPDFERCGDAEGALWHVPAQDAPTPAFWVGYIPTPERYAAVHAAARAKNLLLPNTPDEHLDAQEFDRTYPRLGDLTPASAVVTDPAQLAGAAGQSRKAKGWRACVAESADELVALTTGLLSLENRSRGRVVVRRLALLRHARTGPGDFPLGREFRAFVYRGAVVGLGYYWEGDDPLARLTPDEDRTVRALATEAARRVGAPYVAVDVGQEEGGDWLVVETGDAQFSGLSQIPRLALWAGLRRMARAEA
jgi:hypothetical protein